MEPPSETRVFVDGVPLPVSIEDVTYDRNVDIKTMSYQQGTAHRPMGEHIELSISMYGYLPMLEFDIVHVVGQSGEVWKFDNATLISTSSRLDGDVYLIEWDINALGIDVKS